MQHIFCSLTEMLWPLHNIYWSEAWNNSFLGEEANYCGTVTKIKMLQQVHCISMMVTSGITDIIACKNLSNTQKKIMWALLLFAPVNNLKFMQKPNFIYFWKPPFRKMATCSWPKYSKHRNITFNLFTLVCDLKIISAHHVDVFQAEMWWENRK